MKIAEFVREPVFKEWLVILPELADAIDSNQIVGIVCQRNFYEIHVRAGIDPELVRRMRYIGLAVIVGISPNDIAAATQWTDPRPNKIPAPTADKAIARNFDLEVGK